MLLGCSKALGLGKWLKKGKTQQAKGVHFQIKGYVAFVNKKAGEEEKPLTYFKKNSLSSGKILYVGN